MFQKICDQVKKLADKKSVESLFQASGTAKNLKAVGNFDCQVSEDLELKKNYKSDKSCFSKSLSKFHTTHKVCHVTGNKQLLFIPRAAADYALPWMRSCPPYFCFCSISHKPMGDFIHIAHIHQYYIILIIFNYPQYLKLIGRFSIYIWH